MKIFHRNAYYCDYEDGGPLMHFMLNNNDIIDMDPGSFVDGKDYDDTSTVSSSTKIPPPTEPSVVVKVSKKVVSKRLKKNKKHECNICGKIVRSPGLLRLHIDEDHNFVRIKCEICDKRVKKKNLRKHLRIHDRSPKIPYNCDYCGRIFRALKSWNKHVVKCGQDLNSYMVCNTCSNEFTSICEFESHFATCVRPSIASSSAASSSQTDIVLKNLLHSTGDKPRHYCDLCRKEFDSGHLLAKHKSLHDNCTCMICGKVLASKAILKRHMTLHIESDSVTCHVCAKQFTRDSNLKAHMKIHLNIRSHACEECGKLFRRKYHLKRHMLTHTGEKPYGCQLCDKKYTSKESLRCHKRSTHDIIC